MRMVTSSFVVLSLASLTALLLRVTTILDSQDCLKLGQYVSNRFFYLSIYSTSGHLETPAIRQAVISLGMLV